MQRERRGFTRRSCQSRPKRCDRGTLAIMVGGPRAVFDRHKDMLRAMGTDIFYCGQLGMGQVFKLVNNAMVAVIAGGIAEATLMGVKAGADLEVS